MASTIEDYGADERKSRRARKGRAPLEVSAAMTLRDLRLKISAALGLHPGNIIVHALRGDRYEHLAEEERTLAGAPHFSYSHRSKFWLHSWHLCFADDGICVSS